MTFVQNRLCPINRQAELVTKPGLSRRLRNSVAAAALLSVVGAAYPTASRAQTGTTATTTVETITVKAQKRLIRERNSPSAVTELGSADIAQTGVAGSVATLLRSAPSVYVYQTGIGNNEPVLSIRGVRGLETAQTLDGVPMQDLLFGGSGSYLQNILGGYFNLDQISDVSIYPGVAYPDQNTFGTIGGTVAYTSQRPTATPEIDLTGSVGNFGTYNEGIELDSGKFDSGFGTGDNAASVMAKYSNEQTKGYIDNTPARYNNFEAAFDKPYDDGLSKLQGTLLFNTANGLYDPEPVPLAYLDQNGLFSNYPTDEELNKQDNQFLTIYLKNDKYVNDYIPDVGITGFYLHAQSITTDWSPVTLFTNTGYSNPYAVGTSDALPFLQTIDGFGEAVNGDYGYGNLFYDPQTYYYNGNAEFPAGSAACPESLASQYPAGSTNPCGYNGQLQVYRSHTWGIEPRATITPPDIYGISNTIKVGGTFAEEISPNPKTYAWGTQDIPQTPGNLVGGYDGQATRTIFQIYAQDKIDLFDDSLHFTPGLTWEGTHSSEWGDKIFLGIPSASLQATSYCQDGNYCLSGYYKATRWDKEYLPFVNISYDFDKIAPPLAGLSAYGSFGESALFAPVSDFTPSEGSVVPAPSIVHMYEGGLKYDTPKLAITADYFYQKVDRDFGYYENQVTGVFIYSNLGQREMKGVEASFKYQMTPEIQLFGNASHTLAKNLVTALESVTIQEDQFGIVTKDSPVTGVPDWISTFGVDYDKKSILNPGDEFGVRFEGQYTGHQYTSYDLNGFQNVGCVYGVCYGQSYNDGNPAGYDYYTLTDGSTTYDPHGGISPFTIFNLDTHYTMETPSLRFLRQIKFDLNVQNLFNQHFWAYYYKQISPGYQYCQDVSNETFTSGPYKGKSAYNYCGPEIADGIPGEPTILTFTISAKF